MGILNHYILHYTLKIEISQEKLLFRICVLCYNRSESIIRRFSIMDYPVYALILVVGLVLLVYRARAINKAVDEQTSDTQKE